MALNMNSLNMIVSAAAGSLPTGSHEGPPDPLSKIADPWVKENLPPLELGEMWRLGPKMGWYSLGNSISGHSDRTGQAY
jgi:hypothetical protein